MTPHNFPELKPVNSIVCEQTFNYTNYYSNLKAMNGLRYDYFWLYILDLHNNYVEDPRVVSIWKYTKKTDKTTNKVRQNYEQGGQKSKIFNFKGQISLI